MKVWQLNQTETAPVLVTGQVIAVHRGARADRESQAWHHDTFEMTADVRILRSFVQSGQPLQAGQIQVTFFEYVPPLRVWTCCVPPPLAHLEPGETALLPLKQNDDLAQPWKLMADEGVNTTLPARPELRETEPLPQTARTFILRELANLFANGTPAEIFRASGYLARQENAVATELVPRIEAEVGDNRDRWAEIATSVVAASPIERPTFADLLQPGAQSLPLARAMLSHLKPSSETDTLLIRTLIADAPVHAWGSANSLLEFGDHPVLIATLRQALKDDVSGASYIAWTLARNGHQAVLEEALQRALRVCDRQLDQLAALVRKYQTFDRNFYGVLWQYATEANSPREARVLSVVLNDRQPLDSGMRVCDFAVGVLERATGQHFRSIADARAWLEAHHIPR